MPTKRSQTASRRLLPAPPTLRVPDDRGVAHPVADRDAPWAPADVRLRRVRRQQTSALRSLFSADPREWLLFILLWLAMLVALGSGAPPVVVYGVVVVLGLGWVWFGIARANRRMSDDASGLAQQWADPALRRGLCPVCEYNLHGGAPEPDGCVVCPECGSAWRQARLGRSTGAPEGQPIPGWRFILDPAELNTTRLVDDQARRHRAEGLRSLLIGAGAPPQRIEALARAVRELRRRSLGVRIVIALLFLMPLGGAVPLLTMPAMPQSARFAAMVTPLLLLWLAIMILRSDIGVSGAARIRTLLADRFCPVCGGDLEGRPANERGFTACPDCSARWRWLR